MGRFPCSTYLQILVVQKREDSKTDERIMRQQSCTERKLNGDSATSTRRLFWHRATSRSCGYLCYAVSPINRTSCQGLLLCATEHRHHMRCLSCLWQPFGYVTTPSNKSTCKPFVCAKLTNCMNLKLHGKLK